MKPKGECIGQVIVHALDNHDNNCPSHGQFKRKCIFCHDARAQSEYSVINLIHTQRK